MSSLYIYHHSFIHTGRNFLLVVMMMTSVTDGLTYDVFIHFRCEDTRSGFTNHLYSALISKGIKTFFNDDEIRRGHEISPSLVKAIESSRMAIVVLSKHYASSSSCLQELTKILEFMKDKGRPVWPVFYDGDPSDVKRLTGTYGEAMAKHEARSNVNTDQLQKWKNALRQVADLPGFHYNGHQSESEVLSKIVEEVCENLSRDPLPTVVEYKVGLKSPLEEVISLMELGSDEVVLVGIYGALGIGKTTLARATCSMIANQFEGYCFLDVRENSYKRELVHLQSMLLSKIAGEKYIHLGNVNEGVTRIKHRLHQRKVLLILDDVETLEQLESLVGEPDWFGPGSRVIITTRNKHLLAFHGVERRYEVQALNHEDALELLRLSIFRNDKIDPSYTDILEQVLTYASGNPLALRFIGSYMHGKTLYECMRYASEGFKKIHYSIIEAALRATFNAFEKDEQSVLLDIAACFNGFELEEVQNILCAHYGYNMKYHIQGLIDKSFLSISSKGKVTLHPLIEDMGKEIVRRESLVEPGKRSRLWFSEDIVQVLKENKGSSKTEIIYLDYTLIEDNVIEWDGEAFKKMINLKTLIIRECQFSEAPKHLPNSLKVLEWPSQELPSEFDPEQLYICKLPNKHFMSPKLAELQEIKHRLTCSVSEVLQTSQRIDRIFQVDKTWRLVGFLSSIVGLLCYALSPSFNRLIGGWNILKLFLYGLLSLVICTTTLFAKQSSIRSHHFQLKVYMNFSVLLIISVYSFFYDKAMSGKPEILSLVSNAAFALMSLSLSKLIKLGFEIGMFAYFLGCLTAQLWTIDWKLIFVAIFFGCPLFYMHLSSQQPEVSTGSGQVIHSSSDSRSEIGNDGPLVIDIHT